MDNPVKLATQGTQYEGIKKYHSKICYRSVVLFEHAVKLHIFI